MRLMVLIILTRSWVITTMLNFNIDSCEAATRLIRLCEKYHGEMEIDVIHGRYIIDGCSTLGVHSLIGHIVTIEPHTDDNFLLQQFAKDLQNCR